MPLPYSQCYSVTSHHMVLSFINVKMSENIFSSTSPHAQALNDSFLPQCPPCLMFSYDWWGGVKEGALGWICSHFKSPYGALVLVQFSELDICGHWDENCCESPENTQRMESSGSGAFSWGAFSRNGQAIVTVTERVCPWWQRVQRTMRVECCLEMSSLHEAMLDFVSSGMKVWLLIIITVN